MTAHKHAEMINAKIYNMELVVFVKAAAYGGEWFKIDWHDLPANPHQEYFMCHPKHAKECLHWLNGGELEVINDDGIIATLLSYDRHDGWSPYFSFMSEQKTIRIKPRKEKRWIGYHKYGHTTAMSYLRKDDAMADTIDHEKWQFIEIEVEV